MVIPTGQCQVEKLPDKERRVKQCPIFRSQAVNWNKWNLSSWSHSGIYHTLRSSLVLSGDYLWVGRLWHLGLEWNILDYGFFDHNTELFQLRERPGRPTDRQTDRQTRWCWSNFKKKLSKASYKFQSLIPPPKTIWGFVSGGTTTPQTSALHCPHCPLPHKSVPAAETGIGSTPAVVPSLCTPQPPPEWRFPKLWLGRGVEQDRGRENLQTSVDTHKFPISLSLSYQGTVTWLACDAASFLQHFVLFSTSILPSSLSNQLCIIHICWEIRAQLKETNDFC